MPAPMHAQSYAYVLGLIVAHFSCQIVQLIFFIITHKLACHNNSIPEVCNKLTSGTFFMVFRV